MKKTIAQWLLKRMGITIKRPEVFPEKYILVVIPHTSNWDFPMGVAVRTMIGEDISFIAKSSLFKWPHGALFKWMGGVSVDRSKSNNFVQSVADTFTSRDTFKIVIAPEGTRSKVDKLKTGFYYIAKTAGVPMILCAFDWGNGEVRFSEPFYTTDDKDKDFEFISQYFSSSKGLRAEKGIYSK